MEIRKIKCPVCGAILKVQYVCGIEAKTVMCPVCKKASKYTSFTQVVERPVDNEDKTDYEKPHTSDETIVDVIGTLLYQGKSYKLKPGRNTIGRKAETSSATIQIEADRYMSRDHAEIIVRRNSKGEYMHFFHNSKNKNDTFVNGQKVENGDELILNGGEVIKMAHAELRFELKKHTAKHNYNNSSEETVIE